MSIASERLKNRCLRNKIVRQKQCNEFDSQPDSTSGKSTQNAFMLSPYKKLANDSLKRAKLSCMS